jgi:hypothetical protein
MVVCQARARVRGEREGSGDIALAFLQGQTNLSKSDALAKDDIFETWDPQISSASSGQHRCLIVATLALTLWMER